MREGNCVGGEELASSHDTSRVVSPNVDLHHCVYSSPALGFASVFRHANILPPSLCKGAVPKVLAGNGVLQKCNSTTPALVLVFGLSPEKTLRCSRAWVGKLGVLYCSRPSIISPTKPSNGTDMKCAWGGTFLAVWYSWGRPTSPYALALPQTHSISSCFCYFSTL